MKNVVQDLTSAGGYCLPKDTKQLLANYADVPENLMTALPFRIRRLQHTGAEAQCRLIAVNRQILADFRAVIV